ncbi:transcriptional regulator, MarR family [Roseobacter sp. GAI101]|nr:transcriptional regulator, MarR family [Roseobacter sp. GAI101]
MSVADILLRKTWRSIAFETWKVNNPDVKSGPKAGEKTMADGRGASSYSGENLLFLTDEQLRQAIEAMFFAYRGFTADPDRILVDMAYGRAHHRAIHFINRAPGTTVNNLLGLLGVTKQSLNRVLRTLIADGLVKSQVGKTDKRERHLYLTEAGRALEQTLSDAQRVRMRGAFRDAGPEAVAGFRTVLEAMMDPEMRHSYTKLKENGA